MIETPLGVLRRVRTARQGVDAAPLALAIVCAALVGALSSDFVYAPGMYVGFDGSRSPAMLRTLEVPAVKTTEMALTSATVTLISTRGTGLCVADGQVMSYKELDQHLGLKKTGGANHRPVLIKADGALMMRDFMEVCAMARKHGFPGVLIAANNPPNKDDAQQGRDAGR
ncbi:MAG: ExbD/TolR family protein [Opitutales bacterium]